MVFDDGFLSINVDISDIKTNDVCIEISGYRNSYNIEIIVDAIKHAFEKKPKRVHINMADCKTNISYTLAGVLNEIGIKSEIEAMFNISETNEKDFQLCKEMIIKYGYSVNE